MTFKMTGDNRIITVYNLRADTQEFIGKGDAFIPPYTGLPANCTTVRPPEMQAGYIALFDAQKQKWRVSEDHRGETVFDTATGNEIHILEPGAYPDGTTPLVPENAWQKWNGDIWVHDADAEREAQVSEAETLKKSLLKQAGDAIATLQDAVDFEMAEENEKTRLVAWKKYRVLLSRVRPEDAPDIEWPPLPA